MIAIEKHIPNLLTIGNLLCGLFGILFCFDEYVAGVASMQSSLALAGAMVFAGATLDLLDGMSARLLKAHSPIGGELDSLADVVTFGVLPAMILHKMLLLTQAPWMYSLYVYNVPFFSLLPFIIPAAAALRLARFNIDTTQRKSFKGLPTPATGLFIAALPLMARNDFMVYYFNSSALPDIILNPVLLIVIILLLGWLMNSRIRLFSFKGGMRGAPLMLIIAGLLLAPFLFWAAVPVLVILYVILSLIFNKDRDEVQSAH